MAPDQPVAGWLAAAGFEPYAETVVMARPVENLPRADRVPGVTLAPYDRAWAEAFTAAESAAMADLATFREMGSPTGYEAGAEHGAFRVVRRGREIVGFAHVILPDGQITWLGVVPAERRKGIGRMLVGAVAEAVQEARGTHLVADPEAGTAGQALLARLGFRDRGRRLLMIRRA